MGEGSLSTKSVLRCNIGDSAPVLLCSLLPEKSETVPLNLHFGEEEDVVLSVLGPRSIHLSGYHIGSSNGRDGNKSYPHYVCIMQKFFPYLFFYVLYVFCLIL